MESTQRDKYTWAGLISAERAAEFDVGWAEHELELATADDIARVGAEL